MSEDNNLQPILDYYRTRCYQTEYEYLVYQQSAKEKIAELESRIRELSAGGSDNGAEAATKQSK